jgi:hypothetical protein
MLWPELKPARSNAKLPILAASSLLASFRLPVHSFGVQWPSDHLGVLRPPIWAFWLRLPANNKARGTDLSDQTAFAPNGANRFPGAYSDIPDLCHSQIRHHELAMIFWSHMRLWDCNTRDPSRSSDHHRRVPFHQNLALSSPPFPTKNRTAIMWT